MLRKMCRSLLTCARSLTVLMRHGLMAVATALHGARPVPFTAVWLRAVPLRMYARARYSIFLFRICLCHTCERAWCIHHIGASVGCFGL